MRSPVPFTTQGLVERVSATPAFRGEDVINRLLADLGRLEEPVLLVVDDLHELTHRRRCGCSSTS